MGTNPYFRLKLRCDLVQRAVWTVRSAKHMFIHELQTWTDATPRSWRRYETCSDKHRCNFSVRYPLMSSPQFLGGQKQLINAFGEYQFHLVTFHGEAGRLITSLCYVIVSSRYCDPVCKLSFTYGFLSNYGWNYSQGAHPWRSANNDITLEKHF